MTDPVVPDDDDPDTYHERGVYCGESAHCTPPYPGADPGTPYDQPEPAEFARVVDDLREQYRPGVPDDVVPDRQREQDEYLIDTPAGRDPVAEQAFGYVPHAIPIPEGMVPGPGTPFEGHVAWATDQVAEGEQAMTGVVRDLTGRDLVVEYDTTPLREAGLNVPPEVMGDADAAALKQRFVDARLLGSTRLVGPVDNTVRVDWSVAPTSPAPQRPLYVAACSTCAAAGENIGEPGAMAVPFSTEADRDRWAAAHANERGHVVSLAEQAPETGTTVTDHVAPVGAVISHPRYTGAAAAPKPPIPPLVAFIAREQGPPDLVCRIPPRAGAAWLLTAAHACMLGKGSLGIEQPHRVLYVARLTRGTPGSPDDWQVRVDGVLGATGAGFGAPVGAVWGVSAAADIPTVEDAVEALLGDEFGIGRHLFSVILMTDAPVGTPPDEHSEQVLRDERLAARERSRDAGGHVVDAVREFVDRPADPPVHRTDAPWRDSDG
jgi:hypothetical protein